MNIQNDLDSRQEIARRSSETETVGKESNVELTNPEKHAKSQDLQKYENHILTQTGTIKKKAQTGRKAKRDTQEIPI